MKTRNAFFQNRVEEIFSNKQALKRELHTRVRPALVKWGYWLNTKQVMFPTTIILVVNGECNARCKICDFGTKPQDSFSYSYVEGKPQMEISLLKKIINQARGKSTDLWFMATEPLLYKDLQEAMHYATRRGLRTHITTNGLLLEKMAEALVDEDVYRINVSIDGPRQINDFIRGVPGAFDKALAGIKKVLDIKADKKKRFPLVGVNCCISEYNVGHLIEFIENLKDLDIDYVHFNHLQFVTDKMATEQQSLTKGFRFTPTAVFQTDPGRVNVEVLKGEISQITRRYKKMRIEFLPHITKEDLHTFYLKPEKFISGFNRCYYPWRYFHILPDGEVIVAYRCFSNSMGNVNNEDLDTIWKGPKFREFRKFIKDNRGALNVCSRCSLIFCSYYL